MKANITRFGLAGSDKTGSQDAWDAQVWQDSVIAAIADGVGSAVYAQEAAAKAVESIISNFKSRPPSWSVSKALDEFARLTNRTLYQESIARMERPEMLCTLGVVAVEGEKLSGLNVGDSRLYHFHQGQLSQLSVDHVEEGPEASHVLSRALGMTAEVAPHFFECAVAAGDSILLCTDGVSNLLTHEQLQSLLARGASARTIVSAARERANEETWDDLSAIVVEIVETDRHKAQPLEILETLQAGQRVDGLTLVRPLNQTERTWIAQRDTGLVVVKFPSAQARHSEAVRTQFLKEIWSLTRFKADFFINAFVPENSRVLCYCMEYVEAPTLREFMRKEALAVDEAVALGKFLLDAGQFLMGFDLAHGDLKPENILVLRHGEKLAFKLIDFGSVSEIFSVTSRAGTPSYLAPERFHGLPITEHTEIFSIGVILFQALTRVFPYGEIEPFQTPAFRQPKQPSLLNPNLPPWLEVVLLRAIAIHPEERYQSFSEVKFDLDNPTRVKPWFRKDAPLLERDPLRFYKSGFFVLLALHLVWLIWWMRR